MYFGVYFGVCFGALKGVQEIAMVYLICSLALGEAANRAGAGAAQHPQAGRQQRTSSSVHPKGSDFLLGCSALSSSLLLEPARTPPPTPKNSK